MFYFKIIGIIVFGVGGLILLFHPKRRAKMFNEKWVVSFGCGSLSWAFGLVSDICKQDTHDVFKMIGSILFIVTGILLFSNRSHKS